MPDKFSKKVVYPTSDSLADEISGNIRFHSFRLDSSQVCRTGEIITPRRQVDFITFSNRYSRKIIYLSKKLVSNDFVKLIGLPKKLVGEQITIPGQLILGSERSYLFSQAIKDYFKTKYISNTLKKYSSDEVVAVPILREGIKYGISDALFISQGFLSHEIIVDVHHVSNPSSIPFKRKAEIALFKDADLTETERKRVKVVIVGDSVASGIALISLAPKLLERFPNLEIIEFIAPLATALGIINCSQIIPKKIKVRWHIFETILNTIKPEYYWSPHFLEGEMHIHPSLQYRYQNWWGVDSNKRDISLTVCAGYGWSESFFNPTKQIKMINEQLQIRHKLSIKDLIIRSSSL